MKHLFKTVLVLVCAIGLMSAGGPAKKNNLIGVWNMVSGKTNGIDNPPLTVDRSWEFKKDNTFEGKLYLPEAVRTYNEGIYLLADDSTMLTVHTQNGKMTPFSYKYNFAIKKDTLHLYGFYLTGARDKPGLLQPVHIDEYWVKVRLE